MHNPIAIIDVDNTVVNSSHYWIEWMNSMTGLNYTVNDLSDDYYIGKYYEDALSEYNVSPLDFWRSSSVYDTMSRTCGSYEGLSKLKSKGYDIVFVSIVKGNHNKSKYNFLKRNFGDIMDGYVATKEKHYVSSGTGDDIIIDDRNEFLNMTKAKYKFRIKTPYKQNSELCDGVIDVSSIIEASNYI